jgi:transcriptional regulator with XRE-family HTH domain
MRADDLSFGQRLRQARLLAGFSQTELELRSGIPKARLSRYENGHVLPSLQTLGRLSEALGVSEATLLGDQRAILEEFFNVLYDRGVRIYSSEQSVTLANAIADMVLAIRSADQDAETERRMNGAGPADGSEPEQEHEPQLA